jgi:voltage-gated potassium channel
MRRPTTPRFDCNEDVWKTLELLTLAATIPAFYMAMLALDRATFSALYGLAALLSASVMWKERRLACLGGPSQHRRDTRPVSHHLSALLVSVLVLSAVLPPGDSLDLLGVRLVTAAFVILRMGQSLWPRWAGLTHLLSLAMGVLGLCGMGFWWLEPQVHSLGEGMWLAFTTAATVGYGDIVPTTPASKIFAVFVVLLGFAALSLVTAAIAAMWVQSDEERMEDEILLDLHRQLKLVRDELASMKQLMVQASSVSASPDATAHPGPQADDGQAMSLPRGKMDRDQATS